jgi:hypothetical protein
MACTTCAPSRHRGQVVGGRRNWAMQVVTAVVHLRRWGFGRDCCVEALSEPWHDRDNVSVHTVGARMVVRDGSALACTLQTETRARSASTQARDGETWPGGPWAVLRSAGPFSLSLLSKSFLINFQNSKFENTKYNLPGIHKFPKLAWW